MLCDFVCLVWLGFLLHHVHKIFIMKVRVFVYLSQTLKRAIVSVKPSFVYTEQ